MPNWTTDQLCAIQAEGSDILVAAAAGSGKTAVLVERVLQRVTDPNHPTDIDRFLIVTFTSAAAGELRGKLADALRQRLAESPNNAHLRRQTLRVHQASISTVHAFCMRLLREHAVALDLPPDFRMLDEAENGLLEQEVLEQVIEQAYTQGTDDFTAACELLGSARDDRALVSTIYDITRQLQAQPDPLQTVRTLLEQLQADESMVQCVKQILTEAHRAAAYGKGILIEAVAQLEVLDMLVEIKMHAEEAPQPSKGKRKKKEEEEVRRDKLSLKYMPAFADDLEQCAACELELLLQVSQLEQMPTPEQALLAWQACQAVTDFTYQRLGVVKSYDDPALQQRMKQVRDRWKKIAGQLQGDFHAITTTQMQSDHMENKPALRGLLQTIAQYLEQLAQTKQRRGSLSFSDLEHYAIRLLYQEGEVSTHARDIARQYDGVMVDEYQDTNAVQDAIFHALGAGKRFLVGDVKQSIYRFRLANPYIFLHKYQTFSDTPDPAGQRIVLSKNFRSRACVLDAVNYIFRDVMSPAVGDLAYTEREQLYVGAEYYPVLQAGEPATELHLIDTSENPWKLDEETAEARLIATRIYDMLQAGETVYDSHAACMRPLEMGDICILMRSPNRKLELWRTELERLGLSIAQATQRSLLDAVEVRTMLSLLEIIDNPRQDVALIGVLHAPLFGFTQDMLAQIRLQDRKVSLYEAMQQCDLPQAVAFVELLQGLRLQACDLPVQDLLWQIYNQTNALAIYGAQADGVARQQNLLALLDRARAMQTGGLYQFVTRMRTMREQGRELSMTQAEGGQGVHIMSIHKSKGLEFPVVVLADTAHKFNEQDRYGQVLLHESMGLVGKRRDLSENVRYETLERLAVTRRMRAENVSEELRLLYVGLTRAKERLIISGCCNLPKVLPHWSQLAEQQPLPVYEMATVTSMLPWIAIPCMRHESAGAICTQYQCKAAPLDATMPQVQVQLHTMEDIGLLERAQLTQSDAKVEVLPTIEAPFVPSAQGLRDIPAKLTATGIKKLEQPVASVPQKPKAPRRPDFAQQAGLTPTERGTAHHLFLQYCDFARCQRGEYEEELARLLKLRQITCAQASAIDLTRIASFFEHPDTQAYLQGQVRREVRFSVTVPAQDYYAGVDDPAETVLLQGVIDCLVQTAQGFVIIDFKTDNVSVANQAQRASQYAPQLQAYQKVVELIYGQPVQKALLFFTKTGAYFDCATATNG